MTHLGAYFLLFISLTSQVLATLYLFEAVRLHSAGNKESCAWLIRARNSLLFSISIIVLLFALINMYGLPYRQ